MTAVDTLPPVSQRQAAETERDRALGVIVKAYSDIEAYARQRWEAPEVQTALALLWQDGRRRGR